MTTELEPSFIDMLQKAGVDKVIQDRMKDVKCYTIDHFANWIDDRADLKQKLM